MPIPTDTYWNIKRLNVVFALSSVALLAVTAWAILQDHDKSWRVSQENARVWEAAMVDEKISRTLTPDEQKQLDQLQQDISSKQSQLEDHDKNFQDLSDQRKKLQSDQSTLQFKLNNLKANVQVMQSNLQDAMAAQDQDRVKQIQGQLQEPAKTLADWTEQLAAISTQIKEISAKLDAEMAQITAMKKERSEMATIIESMQKREASLLPQSMIAKLSSGIRNAPLMGFMNPSEKIQQIVLPDVQTDVAFMKITTIDRCITCHTNIANKEFTEAKVIAYLEEQTATIRKLNLPAAAGGKATDPSATATNPGGVAAVEFWHNWALKISPDLVKKNNSRLAAISRGIGKGKPVSVVYDGQPVDTFKYDLTLTDENAIAKQNDVLLAAIGAFYRANTDISVTYGKAVAKISSKTEDRPFILARNIALRYAEELKNGLKANLSEDQYDELENRYRFALVDEVNVARKQQGLSPLSASPVQLAHPRLDLYVDVDSPHSFEAVGCTACHDGSGQETDFVVAAHTPRNIFVDAKTGAPVLDAQLVRNGEPEHPRDFSNMLAVAEKTPGLHFPQSTTQPATEQEPESLQYIDPASGKGGEAMTQMAYWKKIYEPDAPRGFDLVYHEWDWPMRTPQYIQANCARCHTDVYDIKETAPVLYEGRQLFTQLGCVNCHQMDSIPAYENRKVGTDLRHVTAKLSPAYINTWIWAPKAFRPTTKMPHFFMLENNSSDEEIRRTRQEARAITEYLVRTATPLPPKYIYPIDGQGSADAGKAIFNSIGCLACHQNLNERGEDWITTDLVKRAGMNSADAKSQYNAMTYNERQLYVQQHLAETAGHMTKSLYPDGSPKPVFVQVGPELSGIGTKLTAGRTMDQAKQWLFDWLKEPRHYSEYTIMPRLRLSDQQAMDLAAYLLDQKRTNTDPNDKWSAGLTPVDSKKLIELTSLQLRNRYSIATSWVKADDDAELTSLATNALTTPVTPADEAKTEVAGMSKDEKRMVFLGQKLIGNYGCMSCHAINGMETVSSPCADLSSWGQKAVDKLDFGYLDHHKLQSLPTTSDIHMVNGLCSDAANLVHDDIHGMQVSQPVEVSWPEVDHSRNSWITQKLKNTRVFDRGRALLEPSEGDPGHPYDKLKMPTFYLNDEQVHAIVTFVISNRDRLISDKLTQKATNEEAKKIARGRELTERYNCVACHQIEKNVPEIQQYYDVNDVITHAPPSLRGEGNKIQYSWLFNFFKNVEQMRPLLFTGIRMPSFPATDDEFSAIVAYFNAVSNKESKHWVKEIDPVVKYIDVQTKASPGDEKAGLDWWQQPAFASAADDLKQWGLTFGHIKPIEVGPTATPADLQKVYHTLLFKARFTEELYNAPFPFVDSPRPDITDARFHLGEHFFYEMQCLKCHVLGDPAVPGANNHPTAPNLGLAYRRLQQRWVRHWVQEPNIIQVGTAMPPFFTGLPIWELHGQPWPASQGESPEQVKHIESIYGSSVDEQTGLLLDFLYAAGVRGYTGVQPTTPAAPTTQSSDAGSVSSVAQLSH